jgi:hypothetical protein
MTQAINTTTTYSVIPYDSLTEKETECDELTAAFAHFVVNLQNEIKTLQNIATMKQLISQTSNAPSRNAIVEQLRGLEATMSQVEENMGYFEEQVDQELMNLKTTKELLDQATKQQEELLYLQSLMPKKGVQSVAVAQASASPARSNGLLISDEEFQLVSKTTRGRLSIHQVHESLIALNEYIDIKRKVCSQLND